MDTAGALAELKKFQGERKGAGDYYSQFQNELGVGSAQQRANDLRGVIRNTETALKGVGESVAGRTRGQLVTEAQRSRLANIERQPIAEQLSGLQGSYSDEMTNYRDLLGQAGTKAQLAYQTDADRLAALESNYNKLFQQDQAAEERRRFEAQLTESRRSSQAALAAQASLFNPSVGGGGNTGGQQPDANKMKAMLDVQGLLGRKGSQSFLNEIQAIAKSAGYGNTYDQAKLELIKAAQPGLFPGGNLNTKRLNQLRNTYYAQGIMK